MQCLPLHIYFGILEQLASESDIGIDDKTESEALLIINLAKNCYVNVSDSESAMQHIISFLFCFFFHDRHDRQEEQTPS